jgi:hypothetical protein
MDIKRIEREIGESVKKALEGIIKGDSIFGLETHTLKIIRRKADKLGENKLYKYISDCLQVLKEVSDDSAKRRYANIPLNEKGDREVTKEVIDSWEAELTILAEEEVRKRGIKLEV